MPPSAVRPALLSRQAGQRFSLALRPCSSIRQYSNEPPASSPIPPSLAINDSVPPESPNYVKFPKPPQSDLVLRPRQRGSLPVPRDVFRTNRVPGRTKAKAAKMAKKSDPEAFVASAAPHSKMEERGEAPKSEREALRLRLAEYRRQGLEEGLRGLWERKQDREQTQQARSTAKAERNRWAALHKPEGRDDVLTRPSVREATSLVTKVIRDPLRHEKQAASAARTAALAQEKREARRDVLLDLYHAAGKFIVDEKDLEKRVTELFRPDYFKEEGYSYGTVNAENIWDVVGKPPSVRDMMEGVTRTDVKLFESKRTGLDRTTKRQKLVTEALTGGKMPV